MIKIISGVYRWVHKAPNLVENNTMKKYCTLLLITGSLYCIASCGQAGTEPTANEKMRDTTTTTAATFDLRKAREWIESDNKKFEEEVKRGDSNALAAHYASDAWLMFDNMEPQKGNDIASAWGGAIRSGMKEIKINTVDMVGNADLLAETGTFEVMGDGNKVLDKGKYVVVWKPVNGGWKIYRDIGNSNMPMNMPMKKK
jgi:ketosteroid isomerase-like protein